MSQARKLIPLLDRVLVEKIIAPTKTVGGVLLPESAVQKVRAAMPDLLPKPQLECSLMVLGYSIGVPGMPGDVGGGAGR